MHIPELLPFAQMAVCRNTLYPALLEAVANPLVYSNAHLCGQDWFARLRLESVLARDVAVGEVVLGRYPAGAVLLGLHTHWVLADGVLDENQIHPTYDRIAETIADLAQRITETRSINQPCVLLARYGATTWAHWLGDLLSKAVAVEDRFPGQYAYAVPAEIIAPDAAYAIPVPQSYADAVRGSLAAYGIGADRIIALEPHCNYRCKQLMNVHGVWLGTIMHPHLLTAMRANVARPDGPARPRGGRLAILRRDAVTRPIHNGAEVEDYLVREGFEVATMTDLPFIERAAALREHDTVFGIWGSGFMYLVYTEPGTKVLSVAPTDWHDNFITGIIQQCGCRFADIRGPSLWSGDGLVRDAPFVIDVRQLAIGLDRLDAPAAALVTGGMIEVLGGLTPVRVGPAEITLSFAAGGNAWPRLETGWSMQEPTQIWSLGAASTLSLAAAEFSGDYILEVECGALVAPPHLVAKPVTIRLNDTVLATFALGGYSRLSFPLPAASYAGHDRLRFTFEHPMFPSPHILGLSEDVRPLGLALLAMRFRRLVVPA
jgi:hypothetical protein